MDQRDQELLDKQLKLVNRSPRNGVLGLGLVFLTGIAIGGKSRRITRWRWLRSPR